MVGGSLPRKYEGSGFRKKKKKKKAVLKEDIYIYPLSRLLIYICPWSSVHFQGKAKGKKGLESGYEFLCSFPSKCKWKGLRKG